MIRKLVIKLCVVMALGAVIGISFKIGVGYGSARKSTGSVCAEKPKTAPSGIKKTTKVRKTNRRQK